MTTLILILIIMFCVVQNDNIMNMIIRPNKPVQETFLGERGPLRTWEPSTSEFDNLSLDEKYKKYPEDLNANVDKSIIDSHANYLSDADFLASTGSSHSSENDHFTPPVSWHGLPRGAHYAQLGSERSARVSQSETPEEVADYSQHNSTNYIL